MNKVYLIGNLTRDPEISTTTSGISVCRMSIAVGRRFANAEGGRDTDFFNVTAWRGTAEGGSEGGMGVGSSSPVSDLQPIDDDNLPF